MTARGRRPTHKQIAEAATNALMSLGYQPDWFQGQVFFRKMATVKLESPKPPPRWVRAEDGSWTRNITGRNDR